MLAEWMGLLPEALFPDEFILLYYVPNAITVWLEEVMFVVGPSGPQYDLTSAISFSFWANSLVSSLLLSSMS